MKIIFAVHIHEVQTLTAFVIKSLAVTFFKGLWDTVVVFKFPRLVMCKAVLWFVISAKYVSFVEIYLLLLQQLATMATGF